MKTCKRCKVNLSLDNFGKSKRHKDGLLSNCKKCESEKRRIYFKENPEALENKKERERKWKTENKERKLELDKRYRENNRERLREVSREYAKNNKDKVKKAKLKYETNNPQIRAKIKVKRRQAERDCVPNWAEHDKIKEVYKKAKWLESITGLKYHVDHIIPIQGENVCGLHCWSNLQILEASINCSKQNKVFYEK